MKINGIWAYVSLQSLKFPSSVFSTLGYLVKRQRPILYPKDYLFLTVGEEYNNKWEQYPLFGQAVIFA